MKKLVLVFVLMGLTVHAQFTIPEKPGFQTSVYDYADVLSQTEEKELESKLIQFYKSINKSLNIKD